MLRFLKGLGLVLLGALLGSTTVFLGYGLETSETRQTQVEIKKIDALTGEGTHEVRIEMHQKRRSAPVRSYEGGFQLFEPE